MRVRFDIGFYPIAPRVYVGGMPRRIADDDDGLDVDFLVLCAGDWTPDDARVNVLTQPAWWIPLCDDGVEGPDPDRLTAVRAALREARAWHDEGGTVAFTCYAGRNRSGLLGALFLVEGGMAPADALATVQQAHPKKAALTNQGYASTVLAWQPANSPAEFGRIHARQDHTAGVAPRRCPFLYGPDWSEWTAAYAETRAALRAL